MLLKPATILAGRYKIERILGQGGMGAVYLASDLRLPEKFWALKELWDFGDSRTRSLVQNQFKTEASILSGLEHPNLPRITDFFVENDKEYLVMDFINGKTLEDILKERSGPLLPDFVGKIASQIIDVLEYLHSRKPPVIFRDLKPANIMISPDGNLKLIDFGIARIFSSGKSKDTVVLGTPGFAAPEQYGTGQSDERTDIYGLGATLYYCVTGKDPSDNPFHFDHPSGMNIKIPERLEKAILKCVQLNPDHRFKDTMELREYLFGHGSGTTLIPPAVTKIIQEEPALPEKVSFEPEILDFGMVKKGDARKRRLIIKGNVSGAKIGSDFPWIRIYPGIINGENQNVGVTVYTNSLRNGAKYSGMIMLRGKNVEKALPFKLEIEPKHLGFLVYVLAFMFTVLSFVPAVGFVGFIFNLASYFSVPAGERSSLKIFLFISAFASVMWLGIAIIWIAASHPEYLRKLF